MTAQSPASIPALNAKKGTSAEPTIYFFDLAPVLVRIGTSGFSKPERLQLICERHVRSIAGSDLVLFADQGFYLVITSCVGPMAQGLANYVNTSLLMLLFGVESLTPEQSVTMYQAVEADELPESARFARPILVRPEEGSRFDANWDANDTSPKPEEEEKTAFRELERDGVMVERGGELNFFPVHDLRRKAVSALFCSPTFAGAVFGHQAFQDLSPAELPYVDRAILNHSIMFAGRLAEAGIVVAVGAPVSFETLAWSKSRQIYQWALRAANVAQNPQIILKIEDIPIGTPASRISQIVSAIRPFAKHVFVHLPNDHVELTMAGRIGASGLVLSLQRRAAAPEILADSRWLSRAAIAQTAMSCIDHVESDEALTVVRSAGIRFAVGHVFGAETIRGIDSTERVRRVLERIETATTDHLRSLA